MAAEETLRALHKALQLLPDNLPLRQYLADTRFGLGHFEEAERELSKIEPALNVFGGGFLIFTWMENFLVQVTVQA